MGEDEGDGELSQDPGSDFVGGAPYDRSVVCGSCQPDLPTMTISTSHQPTRSECDFSVHEQVLPYPLHIQ